MASSRFLWGHWQRCSACFFKWHRLILHLWRWINKLQHDKSLWFIMFPPVYNQAEWERERESQTEGDWKRQRHSWVWIETQWMRPCLCTAEWTGLQRSFESRVWNSQPPKSVGVVFSRRKAIKIPKSSMCSAPWNMTYGTAKTERADVLSPQNGRLLLEASIPHKGGLWEYDTSMEVSSRNPQEALTPPFLLLVSCHHIHSPFPDRCL